MSFPFWPIVNLYVASRMFSDDEESKCFTCRHYRGKGNCKEGHYDAGGDKSYCYDYDERD